MKMGLVLLGVKELSQALKRHEKAVLKERKKVMNIASLRIVRDAKRIITTNKSVITGNLRASIHHNVFVDGHVVCGDVGTIGTKKRLERYPKTGKKTAEVSSYAHFVEDRKPFLRPAFEQNREKTIRDFKEILKRAPF